MLSRQEGRKILPYGLGNAVAGLMTETKIFIKHRNGVRKARSFAKVDDIKLNFGCGRRIKKGWINVDLCNTADLTLDLREPLPFRNQICSFIYSEHFLEHIGYPEPVSSLLRECYRVMKPGAVFSVVVPDIDLVMRAYVNGGDEAYYEAQKKWHPKDLKTQIEQINYNFRQQGEHKFCYDLETLKMLLEKCGFTNVRRREFDPALDTADRIVGSLYVDCIKG